VSEFGFGQTVKYVRFLAQMDTSSMQTSRLSWQRSPEFKRDTLFLQVLLEGQASLYKYQKEQFIRFFYRFKDSSQVEQLVYKKFHINTGVLNVNEHFKMQLLNNFKCDVVSKPEVEALRYAQSDLLRWFKKYNNCQGVAPTFEYQPNKLTLHLNVRPGVALVNNAFESDNFLIANTTFNSVLGYRLGMEAELVLPTNRNKWAVIAEPTFQRSVAETETSQGKTSITYTSLELPIGVRYYMFLSPHTRLFLNAQFLYDRPFGSSEVRVLSSRFEPGRNFSVLLGGGINYKRGFAELRYSNRDILANYGAVLLRHQVVTLVLGVRVF
jgi:hypothetical protein